VTPRQLGATGLPTTPIGVGLAAVGRPAYIDLGRDLDLGDRRTEEDLRRRTHELLDAARASGVRYVDAARSYGLAERFLGSWLAARGVRPGELTVASKWGYRYTGGWRLDAEVNEVKDHSLAALRRQHAESVAELGDHLLLYQVHSATLESGILDDREVLSELARLRAGGLAVGLTVSGPRQPEVVRRSLDVRADGASLFQTVQATWNLLEPSVGPALAEASAAGLGVIVKEALANGRLTGRERRDQGPLESLAAREGVGVDAVAIAAALANSWADTVLSGAVSPEQLASNLAALSVALSGPELESLGTLAEPADRYWSERQRLRWR
jgi:aryl-alcohol dehydrogenase-like predicted oxidoreductase